MLKCATTLLVLSITTASLSRAAAYEVPAGDICGFFANLPPDATLLRFSAAGSYMASGDIPLPERPLLIIDGAGCTLELAPGSVGFTCAVQDQKEAMGHVTSRYVIRDFAAIIGGRKAVDLKATLGSELINLKLIRQTEAAVDLRFCLMARLVHVLVTNPVGKGFVLRQGDWPGATAFNSQCNSSVLEQCRVNCAKTTTEAFTVLNSGGVRMLDCVSEGAPCLYDLYLSAALEGDADGPARNTVVKSFTMDGFHVEHASLLASILVNMPSKASVRLSNIYWNGPQTAPVILYTMGQLTLSDLGWWHADFHIASRISAPRIRVERCPSALDIGTKETRTPVKAGSFRLVDPLPGNTALKLTYVHVVDPSY